MPLRDLIQDSDQVFVMGHRMPDMDAIGSAVGVRKMAEMNKVDGYVVLDFNELDNSVIRLMDEIKEKPELYDNVLSPQKKHMNKMTDKIIISRSRYA